ncbi:MAG TPA: toll/interleukin-1 receptor domain-containing protein, partial [Anaerolineae bacterium]|nr:toll/interleukin-1 receptor domain-containing protein [Anaerolineae bacterium]
MQNPTIFVSYSHEDEVEKNQLVTQLSVLQQSDIDIDLWVDDRISAGQDWAEAIDNAMGRAVAAIFLVTANFLTSNFITHTEAPKILARHRQEGMPVFPLIGKHCAWKTVPWLADLNIKPKSKRPVWQTQGVPADDELATLVSEIYEVLKHSGGSIEPPQQKSVSAYLADTLVYLDNFGAVSQDIPPEPQAYHLDWTAYFNSRTRPRQVPAPTTWSDRL